MGALDAYFAVRRDQEEGTEPPRAHRVHEVGHDEPCLHSDGEALPMRSLRSALRRASLKCAASLVLGGLALALVWSLGAPSRTGTGMAEVDAHGEKTVYLNLNDDLLNPEGWYSPFNLKLDALRLPNYTVDWLVNRKLSKPPVGTYQQTSVKLREAECAFDAVQTGNYLARAALQIKASIKTCAPAQTRKPWFNGGTYSRVACYADVAGTYSSFGFMATYLSLIASQCSYTVNLPAICAATIEGLVSALAGLSVQAAFVGAHCTAQASGLQLPATTGSDVWQLNARRLRESDWDALNNSVHDLNESVEALNDTLGVDLGSAPDFVNKQIDLGAEVASCVVDVTTALTYLSQMGIAMRGSSRQCEDVDWTANTLLDGTAKGVCAGTVGEILFSIFQAAAFIASAVAHCSTGLNVAALCVAGLSGILGTLGGVVYLGAGMYLGCRNLPELPDVGNATGAQIGKWFGQGLVRRLQSAASNASRNLRQAKALPRQAALLAMINDAKEKLDNWLEQGGHSPESLQRQVREELNMPQQQPDEGSRR